MELSVSSFGKDLTVNLVYHPPNTSILEFMEGFEHLPLQNIRKNEIPMYLGDFTLWIDDRSNGNTMYFLNMLDNFNMKNIIFFPTYSSGHTLDLVIIGKQSNLVDNIIVDPVHMISG